RLDVVRVASVKRAQETVKVDVGDAVTRADALNRIKPPMDAEKNSASSVLRRRLAKAHKVPRLNLANVVQDHGRDRLMDVGGNTVELIGDKSKGDTEIDVVCLVEVRHHLEGRPTESGVTRGVGWKGRREVDVLGRKRVAARRPQRLPVRVGNGIGIPNSGSL